MLRKSLTGREAEWLDEVQIIVRRHSRAVSQVSRQQWQFGLNIGTSSIPAQQGVYGETMPIMPLAA
jgi:hypothetical protein